MFWNLSLMVPATSKVFSVMPLSAPLPYSPSKVESLRLFSLPASPSRALGSNHQPPRLIVHYRNDWRFQPRNTTLPTPLNVCPIFFCVISVRPLHRLFPLGSRLSSYNSLRSSLRISLLPVVSRPFCVFVLSTRVV